MFLVGESLFMEGGLIRLIKSFTYILLMFCIVAYFLHMHFKANLLPFDICLSNPQKLRLKSACVNHFWS